MQIGLPEWQSCRTGVLPNVASPPCEKPWRPILQFHGYFGSSVINKHRMIMWWGRTGCIICDQLYSYNQDAEYYLIFWLINTGRGVYSYLIDSQLRFSQLNEGSTDLLGNVFILNITTPTHHGKPIWMTFEFGFLVCGWVYHRCSSFSMLSDNYIPMKKIIEDFSVGTSNAKPSIPFLVVFPLTHRDKFIISKCSWY